MGRANLRSMAWRNLWRNRRRTLITVASIALGGCIAVLFTALQDRSFADFIDTAARLGGGHVTLQHPEYADTPTLTRTISDTERLRSLVLSGPDVRRAVVRITGQALVSSANDNSGAFFVAYDPGVEDASTLAFVEGLVEGKLFGSSEDREVILGQQLAKRLGVRLGDKVVYTVTDKSGELVSGMGRLRGTVRTGTPSVDGALCLLPIDTVREVLGYGAQEATRVAVFLSDSRRSAAVAKRVGEVLGPGVAALTWEEVRPELSAFIAMKVGGARVMELVIAVLVAAGIFNTLFVSVMERSREFGILLAIGFTRVQLFVLVMWESLWLGLVGLVAGAAVTVGPYWYLASTGVDLSAMTGEGNTEVAGVAFDPHIRIGIFPENLLLITSVILVATVLTGLYPARRAGRLEPVEAIKLV
jgi:ABC-type lipoprotein release transport system permease subunit